MIKTTKAQRQSLLMLYKRHTDAKPCTSLTYRRFRRQVKPMLMGDGAIVVPWAGMFVAIEPDGYTHT